ncbi:isoleucine--tRNA ligase [Candidatus Acetothermia bacterium]|nr:isoleucine--tRNA ligase [Candidatus Acetothermia bacterium]
MPKYAKLTDALSLELDVLNFWSESSIFQKTLAKTEKGPRYITFEGPPTANGKPHFGHLMPRVNKDIFPRYWTMKGYYVRRKGGWDTHGLPVEVEVEKALKLSGKQDIEKYGIEKFVQKCRESVWLYRGEWEKFMPRMGFWIDLENAYNTYTNEYIETGWWALKTIYDKGLLYKGHKVLPYCPRCGTSLSSHEVAQGYETVKDPSIFVRMKVRGQENTSLLMWTTTPWTVPSNVALAVGEKYTYAKLKVGDEYLILAKDLVEKVITDKHEIVETMKGSQLVGWCYEPPFKLSDDERAYRVVAADFVTLEDGTGIVHTATAFGEDDYALAQKEGLPLLQMVDLEGKFTKDFPFAAGKFVKDADPLLIQDMKQRGFLYKSSKYEHEYPFCWRCKSPLLYYALDSYFVKTTARQKEIIANNKQIHWHPEHMRDGRFGNFLDTMKDWALSRDRYWGTPLPIWVCEVCNEQICVGSRAQLVELAKDKKQAQNIELHRPWIDQVTFECKKCKGEMKRVKYVIDGWFDSGMMHTAQWHYPFENQKLFEEQFPADFIAEGLDQTRGWFYTLLVTSTLLYEDKPFPHPYRHVIVNGMGLDAQGKKMSKSVGNVLSPLDLINVFGADAVRWYLFSSSAPWKDKRVSKEGVAEYLGSLETLRNIYNFFALYAGIDKFDPIKHRAQESERALLDRWIFSRLQSTIQGVTQRMDDYDIVGATDFLKDFIDDLSNWYVRNSRSRFWGNEWTSDKKAAFSTLYEVLIELATLFAPFIPFLAEALHLNLKTEEDPESVHLRDWPKTNEKLQDKELEEAMRRARSIVTAGLQARNKAQIKVRQPLARMAMLEPTTDGAVRKPLASAYEELVKSELNIKNVVVLKAGMPELFEFYSPKLEYDKAKMGPSFRQLAPKVIKVLDELNLEVHEKRVEIAKKLLSSGSMHLRVDGQEVELKDQEHVKVALFAKEGFVEGAERDWRVLIDTHIDNELREEGYVRELIRLIQESRKEAGYEVSDRIEVFYTSDPELQKAIEKFSKHIQDETLALKLNKGEIPSHVDYSKEFDVNGKSAKLGLVRSR